MAAFERGRTNCIAGIQGAEADVSCGNHSENPIFYFVTVPNSEITGDFNAER